MPKHGTASAARARKRASTSAPKPTPQTTVKELYKTRDDFSAPPTAPDTIWYLTINTPSTDKWDYHGPTRTFSALIPFIESAITASNSKAALEKWQKILSDDAEEQRLQAQERQTFGEAYVAASKPRAKLQDVGISTFVIPRMLFEHEEGVLTILKVVREVNPAVYKMLPANVFTITAEGPIPTADVLMTDLERERQLAYQHGSGLVPILPAPRSATSRLVGSFGTTASMKTAAKEAMDAMLMGIEEWQVMRTEAWGVDETVMSTKRSKMKKKKKVDSDAMGGLIMAMTSDARWEVKVKYDVDGLANAVERFDKDPRNVEQGRTASWRNGSSRS